MNNINIPENVDVAIIGGGMAGLSAAASLSQMGVKNITTKDTIKIYGNPNLKITKKIIIKNFLKDHRVFMTCVIAALTFGGKWEIFDKSSIKTSFPSFLNIISNLKK